MAEIWGAAIAGALGVGASLYGANKQAKDNQAAQSQNADLQAQQNNSAWQAYLMSRGINPMGATAGTIPTGAQAINSKLPLWATMTIPGTPALSSPRRLVRRNMTVAPQNKNAGLVEVRGPTLAADGSTDWWKRNANQAYAS